MKKTMKKLLALMLSIVLAAGIGIPASAEENVLRSWSTAEDYAAWTYGEGWEYQYSGAENSSVGYDKDMDALRATVDYSKDADKDWSQMALCYYDDGLNIVGATNLELDFLYDAGKLTAGSFKINAYSSAGLDCTTDVDTESAQTVKDSIRSVHVSLPFPEELASKVPDFTVRLIGINTNYTGDIWLKNIQLTAKEKADTSIDSTISVVDGTKMGTLSFTGNMTLVDSNADASVKNVYAYLQSIGKTDFVLYGHQNDTWHKAGSASLTNSDTRDVTGTIPAVIGIDTLSLVGNEYSAGRYNSEIGGSLPENLTGNIQAAALLTNQLIDEGAIITLSAHMPNFSIVPERPAWRSSDPAYLRWDFSGYTPNNLEGDVVKNILPGGTYNPQFTAYLDMIAAYARQVDGAILFRPFHECTGSWFWWGASLCDPATYKSVFKYTVEYLRDESDIHNLLYVYGPGSEAANTEEYAERYPGDEFVDMVGFDMYNSAPSATDNSAWYASFQAELNVVQAFAKAHNKLLAVTETGTANAAQPGENQTALLRQGNPKDWYAKVLDMVSASDASYFLLWANFGKNDGYYSPYVDAVNANGTLHGHELLDAFIQFYNDQRSVFADQQKAVLSSVNSGAAVVSAARGATGFITAPISGDRVLEPITLAAKVTGTAKVQFVLRGKQALTLDAALEGGLYKASLTQQDLTGLGEHVGTIDLMLDGAVQDTIRATFNIHPPVPDPYEIDDFESYAGVDSLLTNNWATNKASGNTISLTLAQDGVFHGAYALRFDYDETADGWAGATISKEVDWSDCNALQFYTIPDGNAQKVVVQLTANDTVYEVYLNEYSAYAGAKANSPLLVTIPFREFCQRDTTGNPKGGLLEDRNKITSFGLWVNAIGDSAAVVDGRVSGTIYYDQITAIAAASDQAPTFVPGDYVSRAQVWNLLAELERQEITGGAVWYEKGRAWVMAQGISDGTAAERLITRQEFAAMLWRYAGKPQVSAETPRYEDSASLGAWAADAMNWAVSKKILSPQEGKLMPRSTMNHAQVSAALAALTDQ